MHDCVTSVGVLKLCCHALDSEIMQLACWCTWYSMRWVSRLPMLKIWYASIPLRGSGCHHPESQGPRR